MESSIRELGIFRREFKGMLVLSHDTRETARVGHHVPRQRHGHVLVSDQSIAIVPEVVFGGETLVIQNGVLPSLNDFVPQHDLIEFVVHSLILRRQIEEQLLHVPVEEMSQIRLQVPTQESQVVL